MTGKGSSDSAYSKAGVDIDAQDRALEGIGEMVRSTWGAGVLSDVGSFGGLFSPDLTGMEQPVLVSSADGVGTKLLVALMAGDYSTVGRDLVNHCVNDILVQGAVPLFFLDYVGTGVLAPETMAQLVDGVARGCRENGCALLGGETAEMPGFYQDGDYELVGFVVGLVDRPRLLDGSRVREKDVLVGLPSAGLHTNGFSLARHVLFERAGLELGDPVGDTGKTVRDHLLAPHLSYLEAVRPLLGGEGLHAMAHITGGGLTDNLPRILPAGFQADIRLGSWEIPELFHRIQEWGDVSSEEMFRVFNQGIGMVLVVAPDELRQTLAHLRDVGVPGSAIGTVQAGPGGVVYDYPPEHPEA